MQNLFVNVYKNLTKSNKHVIEDTISEERHKLALVSNPIGKHVTLTTEVEQHKNNSYFSKIYPKDLLHCIQTNSVHMKLLFAKFRTARKSG